MSHLSSLNVTYSPETIRFVELASILLKEGWNLNDHGYITYLPLGTNDVSEWSRAELADADRIIKVIKQKEEKGETIGLVIMWKDEEIGCSILSPGKGIISFVLNINRKQASEQNDFTDVNWYLERLLPPLISHGITVVSMRWEEHI